MITTTIILFFILFAVYSFALNRFWRKKIQAKSQLVKETEAQLIQMDKLASLGTLAAGIAHEINNPLGFLISNLQTLKDSSLDAQNLAVNQNAVDELKEITQESLEGAQRIKRIVRDLRMFSRKSEAEKAPIDINQVLESTLSIVWNEVKYKVDIIKDYQAEAKLLADATELSQVFLNILLNAAQSIKDKGTINLCSWQDSRNVYVKISDTGCGIPEEVLLRIFDPFFTTKSKGTGLGLSVSYNIVKQHGGDIKVESQIDKGTTFTFQLPRPKEDIEIVA